MVSATKQERNQFTADKEGQGKGDRQPEPDTRPSLYDPTFGKPRKCSETDKKRHR